MEGDKDEPLGEVLSTVIQTETRALAPVTNGFAAALSYERKG